MIETDIVVSAGTEDYVAPQDDLAQALGVVSPRRWSAADVCADPVRGCCWKARGSELRLAATDMELSLRRDPYRRRSRADGAIVPAGEGRWSTSHGLLPGNEVTIEHRPGRVGGARHRRGRRELHA